MNGRKTDTPIVASPDFVTVTGQVQAYGHEIVLEIANELDAEGKFGLRLLVDGAQHYVGRYEPLA